MHKIILALLCFLITFSTISMAQMTKTEYTSEKKLLMERKAQLTDDIKHLKIEIDSLRAILPDIEKKLTAELSELFILKYGNEIGWRVINKRIWIGMTDEMVKDGWGVPDRIDKNVEPWGVFTQWYYGDILFFFKDSKLTDWQEGPDK